jgi:uncharacterized membrane protein (UPF0127 family)
MQLYKNILKFISIMFLIAPSVMLTSYGHAQAPVQFEHSALVIEARSGVHQFNIELAETPEQRARGLMFREEMAPDAGMLFLETRDRVQTMWMANTALPLDMLFIAADGTIVRIAENTVPFSREIISSRTRVRAVLELNAGTVRRLAISTGDRVIHDSLRGYTR